MQTNAMVGLWLAKERARTLQAEAERARAGRRARSRVRRRTELRAPLASRLVGFGTRLFQAAALHGEGR